MNHVIADITRANSGSEAYLVSKALQRCEPSGAQPLHLVCMQAQKDAIDLSIPNTHVVPDGANFLFVKQKIEDIIRRILFGPDSRVEVYTFHGVVFNLGATFQETDSNGESRVRFSPWRALSSVPQTGQPVPRLVAGQAIQTQSWPTQFMPLDEAVTALQRTLSARGNPIRMTDLRQFLTADDDRFDKRNPGAGTPGLMTMLVNAAHDRGLVEIERRELSNPHVRLKTSPEATSNGPSPNSDVRSTDPRSGQVHSPTQTAQTAKRVPPVDDGKSRSQRFIDILRQKDLGPFSKIRASLYDNLELALTDGITVGELISRTIQITKDSCGDAEYPWRRVRTFVATVLGRCPILMDATQAAVAPSFSTLTRGVVGLKENWRLDLDGVLMLEIVESAGDVCLADTLPLAGALYLSRTDADELRIQRVIERLLHLGRLREAASPPYRLSVVPGVASVSES